MKKQGVAFLLVLASLAGAWLRFSHVGSMEYKEDEQINFTQSQLISQSHHLPWMGMPSGVYIRNPGMSVWVFGAVAATLGLHTPTGLAHGVQGVAWLGILALLPLIFLSIREGEREPWLWAFALAMVNPFYVLYQRKLWPEPFLPLFCVIFLAGFLRREKRWGAFAWGITGPVLGQIHLSGFFLAAGFFLWSLIWERKKPAWIAWALGGILGSLPMLPWLWDILQHPAHEKMVAGLQEAIQLRYWVFWISDALGVHLGNTLGVYRGDSTWAQISDFIRYPLWQGNATYAIGIAHLIALGAGAWILVRAAWIRPPILPGTQTRFALGACFWACGFLLTATTVVIRRYYMMAAFPFEFLSIAALALASAQGLPRKLREARCVLALLWIAELSMSLGFVHYVHVNHGSPRGDYGWAYETLHP